MSWRDEAACIGSPTEWFFADQGYTDYTAARDLCARCPVRQECLDDAVSMSYGMQIGYRGGMTPHQRKVLKAQTESPRRPVCRKDRCVLPAEAKGFCRYHYDLHRKAANRVRENLPELHATVRRVAEAFDVDPELVFGVSQARDVTRVRHWAWWVLWKAGWPQSTIAERLGVNASTVWSACRKMDRFEVPEVVSGLSGVSRSGKYGAPDRPESEVA